MPAKFVCAICKFFCRSSNAIRHPVEGWNRREEVNGRRKLTGARGADSVQDITGHISFAKGKERRSRTKEPLVLLMCSDHEIGARGKHVGTKVF